MKSQIFKNTVPNEYLFKFLEKVCYIHNEFYVFNKIAYKKSLYLNELDPFLELIEPYYYGAKKMYVKRQKSYTNVLTVIRQICKFNIINYTSKITYDRATYDIEYFIYK